jgi:hypothetical protein
VDEFTRETLCECYAMVIHHVMFDTEIKYIIDAVPISEDTLENYSKIFDIIYNPDPKKRLDVFDPIHYIYVKSRVELFIENKTQEELVKYYTDEPNIEIVQYLSTKYVDKLQSYIDDIVPSIKDSVTKSVIKMVYTSYCKFVNIHTIIPQLTDHSIHNFILAQTKYKFHILLLITENIYRHLNIKKLLYI